MDEKNFKKISLTIEENLFINFSEYCKRNGYKISTRVGILMKKDLEREKMDIYFQERQKAIRFLNKSKK